MKILVLNSGSSSIKFQLFQMPEQKVVCKGLVERIGQENAKFSYASSFHTLEEVRHIEDHKVGLQKMVECLLDAKIGVIKTTNEIQAVGHRVVHGGSIFSETTIINEEVKKQIKKLFSLAPLHNPANYEGIAVAENIFPEAMQIAVFDTAFHQTIPAKAYTYAIPNSLLEDHKIRLYGFHGTSHKYVSEKAIEHLGISNSKIITIHLGNGCSITAIQDKKSIDHSLGFGPATGLIMGTRSGDIDHAIIFHMVNNLGYTLEEVNTLLQKESGMLGLTGHSDLRDVEAKATTGDKACRLAIDMNVYRIKKYIGAYASAMNGLDAIVFTAGIGENSSTMRKLICADMNFLGIQLDEEKNRVKNDQLTEIQTGNSKVKVFVIPTNEELEIAKQSYDLIKN